MAKAKVLYISYDGMTDPLGQSQVLPYLSCLSREGYDITLLSAEKKSNFEKEKLVVEKICIDAGINWEPISYTKSPPVLATLWDIQRLKSQARKLHNKLSFDLIHCRGHYITSIVGHALARNTGVPYLFDMRGFWADERIDGGLWSLDNPLQRRMYRYFKNKEREFIEDADAIVTLTHAAREEIKSWDQIGESAYDKTTVIPCCADLDHFDFNRIDSSEQRKIRAELKLGDSFVLAYLGSIGTWYMADEMMEFFSLLQKDQPNSKFIFITGESLEAISQLADCYGINMNDIRVFRSPRKDVPRYLSVADAGVFFIKPLYSKKGSSPVKHGEMMGMGIPVICNDGVGDVSSIVNDTDSGLVIENLDSQSLGLAVNRIPLLKELKRSDIRQNAYKYYDLTTGSKQFLKIYDSLTNNSL